MAKRINKTRKKIILQASFMKHFATFPEYFNRTSSLNNVKKVPNTHFRKCIIHSKITSQILPSTDGKVFKSLCAAVYTIS